MNQKESPARQTQGSIEADTPRIETTFPQFEIANLRAVTWGRICGTFDLVIGPVTIECRIVANEDGRPKFVSPASIKEAYSGAYSSTVSLDRAFSAAVLERIVSEMGRAA